jgi:hypothetical protein
LTSSWYLILGWAIIELVSFGLDVILLVFNRSREL